MQDVFPVKGQGNYNFRNRTEFAVSQVKSINYDVESIRVLGTKIWEKLPNDLKNQT